MLLLWATVAGAQEVYRSGSLGNPALEAPLSEKARKYEALLNISNAALDEIQAGRFDQLYDTRFSPILREDIDRFWLTSQLRQIQELYGKPTGYGKQQWWFQEEKNQGRLLVHSVKLVRYGEASFKFVFTAQSKKPGVLRGFRWVAPDPPRPRLLESSSNSAGDPSETESPPIKDPYAVFKKLVKGCLAKAKQKATCRASFAPLLAGQLSEADFKKNLGRLTEQVGAMRSTEPTRWELHASPFPQKRILTMRNLIAHERGRIWYVFSVYAENQNRLVGFQIRPARSADGSR